MAVNLYEITSTLSANYCSRMANKKRRQRAAMAKKNAKEIGSGEKSEGNDEINEFEELNWDNFAVKKAQLKGKFTRYKNQFFLALEDNTGTEETDLLECKERVRIHYDNFKGYLVQMLRGGRSKDKKHEEIKAL